MRIAARKSAVTGHHLSSPPPLHRRSDMSSLAISHPFPFTHPPYLFPPLPRFSKQYPSSLSPYYPPLSMLHPSPYSSPLFVPCTSIYSALIITLPHFYPSLQMEPKVFFANERTFISWLSMAVNLSSISIGVLAFTSRNCELLT